MANYDNQPAYGTTVARGAAGAIDEGLRAYMLKVYNLMGLGLVITGLAAFGTIMLATTVDPASAVPETSGELSLLGEAADALTQRIQDQAGGTKR